MKRRKTLQRIVILMGAAAFVMGCLTVSGTTPTSSDTAPPTIIQPTAPAGWKVSTDSSGQCQVAAPPEWELGRDFFLIAQEPAPGPFENRPGLFPPTGDDLWQDLLLPEGRLFQIRESLVLDDVVCSVIRIRAEVDFTDAERSELEHVGKTLQELPR
jgi:hypothetical protein